VVEGTALMLANAEALVHEIEYKNTKEAEALANKKRK